MSYGFFLNSAIAARQMAMKETAIVRPLTRNWSSADVTPGVPGGS